jgi:hypothetical protein
MKAIPFWIGVSIVAGSHTWMLVNPPMCSKKMQMHSYLNLGASGLIIYGAL